jgi:putative ABC transport system permease protein
MFSLAKTIRVTLRHLRQAPGFALTTILTLALGIGATTAIFSLVNAVVLKPLPFPEQDRLMWIAEGNHHDSGTAAIPESLSYPNFFDWRARSRAFSGMAAYHPSSYTLTGSGEALYLDGAIVTSEFFRVLGVTPLIGRDFRPEEEKPGNRAVMLSYSLWQSAFGGVPSVVGRPVTLDGQPYTVVGVMPRGFNFPMDEPPQQYWASAAQDGEGADSEQSQRGWNSLRVVARLKPGVSREQAQSELDVISRNLAAQYPDNNKWDTSAVMEPELQHLVGDTAPALRVLFGAVVLVLLIACANVAGLLLARSSRRAGEMALRSALGATRGEILRQMLVESVTLSLLGSALGVLLAYGLLHGMLEFLPRNLPRQGNVSIDGPVLLFALGVAIVTGLLFGVGPAWRIAGVQPLEVLRDGTRSVTAGRGQHRLHSALVVAETALSLVLLAGSGLLIRSFTRVLHVDPGVDPRHVMTARIDLPDARYNREQRIAFYRQLMPRLASLPGVSMASAGFPLPMSGGNIGISFDIEERPTAAGDQPTESVGVVLPGFFESLRIPLREGRTFTVHDDTKGAPVAIVNEAFAKKYFPHEDALGKRIRPGLGDGAVNHPMREIVGIVGDVKRKGLTAETEALYYIPWEQAVVTSPPLILRSSADPGTLSREIRAAVTSLDKDLPIYKAHPLNYYVSQAASEPRFQTMLLSFFAGMALLLAGIGLYGLLSYMVAQRTLEIGLRMAVGAQRSDVVRMIVRRGLRLAAVGLGVGLVASVFVTRLLGSMLFGVRPFDPLTFAVVTALLLTVALGASGLPAVRAARLDPMRTLRDQ